MKLAQLPKGWGKIQIRTARELIDIEFSHLKEMVKSVDLEIDRLESRLVHSEDEEHWALVIKESADRVAEIVARHVMRMRRDARDLADEILEAELDELEIEPERTSASNSRADAASAAAAGLAYASVWASSALSAVLSDEETKPIRRILEGQEYRLERIATTETSRAYNDEHSRAVESIADHSDNKETHWYGAVAKRWEALLDKRTCSICREHDGEIALLGMEFRDGDSPGEIHPNCRCVEQLIPLPAYYSTEAA